MIGLVLVTHGHLATEFRAALEHVVGPQAHLATIAIAPDDDMESRRRDIIAAVEQVETGRGVVILTDMFGGTPSNLAISVMEPGRVDVVAGVNLPMLIKLASVREEKTLDEAVTAAQDAGRKYITVASRVLAGKQAGDKGMDEDCGCPETEIPPGALHRQFEIVNKKGLHARATAKFVQCAARFEADITVSRCGETVGGTSIMGVLTLGAGIGSTITIAAKGPDAAEALDALGALIADRFGEGE